MHNRNRDIDRLKVAAVFSLLWLAGCLCDANMPSVSRDSRPAVVDSKPPNAPDKGNPTLTDQGATEAETAVDMGKFVLNITCPDGSKPDLASMPNCKTVVDKLLDECCPKPNQALNTYLGKMVCVANADGLCKMLLAGGFQYTCDSMKNSKECT